MPRILPALCAGMLCLVALPATSRQVPTAPAPMVTPPPAAPRHDRRPQAVPATPEQRPRSSSPISGEGPAKLLPPLLPPPPSPEPAAAALPTRVFDASGRPLSGMLRVAPTRAFDPATGRYYPTTPTGKVIGPPPAGR